MWKSLATTVVTPRKCPGRDFPSELFADAFHGDVGGRTLRIHFFDRGREEKMTPSFSSKSQSRSKVRGYFERSSLGPNCVGLTKMEVATASHWARAARTSERWPSCNAPMVGTRPRRFPARRRARLGARVSAIVVQIFIGVCALQADGTQSMRTCSSSSEPATIPLLRRISTLSSSEVTPDSCHRDHASIWPGGRGKIGQRRQSSGLSTCSSLSSASRAHRILRMIR